VLWLMQGLRITVVPEQAVADPDFSTGKTANLKSKAAFESLFVGKKIDADILVATILMADRLE